MSDLDPVVTVNTELGDIAIELHAKRAPKTVANFLAYVAAGAYNGAHFFRTVTTDPDNQTNMTVRIDVIEATPLHAMQFPGVEFEATSETGCLHEDGTISMSRDAPLDSATSNFFICVGPQPQLDDGGMPAIHGLFARGFAAFGRVVRGMDLVRAIHMSPRNGQTLAPPIAIVAVTENQD
jgi:peptidyl-prolyl cis-trans isomerase A (cyclophilin A)